MRTCRGLPPLTPAPSLNAASSATRGAHVPIGRAITIGSFDGIHLGHQALIQTTCMIARRESLTATLLSFYPHPRRFFNPGARLARILPLRDKLALLESMGVDECRLLAFNRTLSEMPAEDFVRNLLFQGLGMRHLTVGDAFRFGHRRRGDTDLLERMGEKLGFAVSIVPAVRDGKGVVSSSRIRDHLEAGQWREAIECLGHGVALRGRVQRGQQLGRTLGFPTLNLRMPNDLAISGIFSVWVDGLGGVRRAGVASLGRRPTVENAGRMLLEVFVFDWEGNAYGHDVCVTLVDFIRPEAHFESLSAMTQQMQKDLAKAREQLKQ